MLKSNTEWPMHPELSAEFETWVSQGLLTVQVGASGTCYSFAEMCVAGFRYHDGPDLLPYLQPGEPLDLIAEPGNPYDEWAVRVEHRKSRIGYVPRGINRPISLLLQAGGACSAQVSQVNPEAPGWECLRMQIVARLNKTNPPHIK